MTTKETLNERANKILLYLSIKHKNKWDLIWKDLVNKENMPTLDELDKFYENYELLGGRTFITLYSEDYPESFKHTHRPPFVIYANDGVNLSFEKIMNG